MTKRAQSDNPATMSGKSFSIIWVALVTAFLFLGLLAVNHWSWVDYIRINDPLVDNMNKAKVNISTGHLWLEELITGDDTVQIEYVWRDMENVANAIDDAINGKSNIPGVIGRSVSNRELLARLEKLKTSTEAFREIAEERWANVKQGGIGSSLDQRFDKLFKEILLEIDTVVGIINRLKYQSLTHQQRLYYLLSAISFFLFVAAGIILFRKDKNRKQAEEGLRKSEERFRNIFRNSYDAIFMVDPGQDKIVDVNPKACDMLGYSREELLSTPMSAIHPGEMKRLGDFVQQVFAAGQGWTDELSCRTKKGNLLPVEISASLIEIEGKTFMIAIVRDVTTRAAAEMERLQADKTLRESEERFSKAFQSTPDSITITLLEDGRLIEVNDGFEQITGFSREETLGKTTLDLGIWSAPEDRKHFIEHLQNKGKVTNFETKFRTKTGKSIICKISAESIDLSGQPCLITIARDITKRMEAEKELRQFKETLDQTLDCVFMFDAKALKFIYVNKGAVNQVGYSREELLNMTPVDIKPQFTERSFREMIAPLLDGSKSSHRFETVHRHKNGRLVQVEIFLQYMEQPGETGRFMAFVTDITERKIAEEALRKSEASLSEAQRIAHLGNWDLDLVNNELKWSDEIYRIFEMDPKDFGATYEAFLDTIHPEDRDIVNKAYTDSLNSREPYEITHRLLMKDGSSKYVNEKCETFYDDNGKPLRSVGAAQDITERMLAEEALREKDRFQSEVLNGMVTFVGVLDPSGDIIFINNAPLKATGFKLEDVRGKKFFDIAWWSYSDEVREIIKRDIEQCISGKSILHDIQFQATDGSLIWIEFSMHSIHDEREVVQYLIPEGRVITERKLAEEELVKHRDHLEEMVEERTIELAAVNNELEAFAYSVSHDLRAPLRGIDGFSQALLEDYADKVDDNGKDYLNRVRAATLRMSELIDDLLTLSRVTRSEMTYERVDLTALAYDVAHDLRKEQPERSVEFTVEESLETEGDKRLLHVALYNLISNAWKFTGKRSEASIEIGSTRRDGKTVYFVRDNGVGFDMKYTGKLFCAFQRLHSRAEFPGTGIGLATVQRTIHRHGGRVWADAELGKGAIFYFTL